MAVAELPEKLEEKKILETKERSLFQESMIRLFKNKVAVGSIVFISVLVFVSFVLAPIEGLFQDPISQDRALHDRIHPWQRFLVEDFVEESDKFLLGSDDLGRDLLARVIHGSRVSLLVAFVAATVSLLIGIVYGTISGYLGGVADNIMMRIVDVIYGFPFLIVVILLQAYFKAKQRHGAEGFMGSMITLNESMGGLFFLFLAIGLVNWIGMARIARGQVLSLKKKEYIEAAQSVGATDMRIIFRHLMPNIIGPLIVAETLAIPGYIFTEAFLSFIGLGVDPPTPSWGIMISEAVKGIRSYPYQVLVPAVFLSVTTLAFNFLGDGLRDAFDPRQKT